METEPATTIQILGGIGFGALIGWYTYFINRYRQGDVKFSDLVTLIGIIGGTSILTLFPARTDLFGAYGIGLFLGFFGYFVALVIMVNRSDNFDVDWFLDGRRKKPGDEYTREGARTTSSAMVHAGGEEDDENGSPIGG